MTDKTESVRNTIDDLVRRSDRLRQMASDLAGEYGLPLKRPVESQNGRAIQASEIRSDRLPQLKEFLKANGPQRRSAILEATGIPVGTIGALLKKNCQKNAQGKWHWKAEKAEA